MRICAVQCRRGNDDDIEIEIEIEMRPFGGREKKLGTGVSGGPG